jgi:hypothetical protein
MRVEDDELLLPKQDRGQRRCPPPRTCLLCWGAIFAFLCIVTSIVVPVVLLLVDESQVIHYYYYYFNLKLLCFSIVCGVDKHFVDCSHLFTICVSKNSLIQQMMFVLLKLM